VPVWVGHLLLALAACALGGAAVRAASLAASRGLVRVVAAAPLAVAAAVVDALALGIVGWGGAGAAAWTCRGCGLTSLRRRRSCAKRCSSISPPSSSRRRSGSRTRFRRHPLAAPSRPRRPVELLAPPRVSPSPRS
jgi:hypothetical protein